MQVKWTHSPSGREVYILRGDRSKLPGSEYQNRTALVMDSIALGNLALRIQDIRPSDEGQYVCEFQSNAYSNRTFLELSVGGLGSTPQIHIVGLEPGGIRVRCVSVGWYPAPQLLWRNSQEEILTPDEILETRSEGGLFNISSSIVLQENNHPALSCAVTAVTHKKMSSVLISALNV
uniref:Ig-like domain-containing protein n=1 Tax=Sphenodon punctatus TaxID=8508 RepID=A0A8D0LA70_SPHPU